MGKINPNWVLFVVAIIVIIIFSRFWDTQAAYNIGADTNCISTESRAKEIALEQERITPNTCTITNLPMRKGVMPNCADSNLNVGPSYMVTCDAGPFEFDNKWVENNKCESDLDCSNMDHTCYEQFLLWDLCVKYDNLKCVGGRCKQYYRGELSGDLDGDGVISRFELGIGIQNWGEGKLTRAALGDMITSYIGG